MTSASDNPYESPQTVAEPGSSAASANAAWKLVLKRWEVLRLVYNLLVGLAGLPAIVSLRPSFLPIAIAGALMYGVCANVMYLLGPVTELYVNWFVDAWEGRLVPSWAARFVRSRYLTALLFVAGGLFSVCLTLAMALGTALSASFSD